MPFGFGPFGSFSFGGSTSVGSVATLGGWGGVTTVFVELDFSQAVEGIGAGASTFPALWDAAVWDTDVWASGTVWTDVTSWVREVSTSAKFARLNGQYNPGTASFTLDNRDGRFSPDNTSSPYRIGDSTAIGIWRPCRIRAEYNDGTGTIGWPLFSGFVLDWNEQFPMTGRDAVIDVSCIDAFGQLAGWEGIPVTPVGAGETTGVRIDRILDAAGFYGDRFIDAGEHTCQATTLEGNALSLLRLTADSEGGAVWCGPDGAVYFDAQNALLEKDRSNTVQVVFSDDGTGELTYQNIGLAYAGDLVIDMAAWERVGGSTQTAVSQPSRNLYGDRQSARSDLVCETDGQVLTLVDREVALYQTPERRVESLEFNPVRDGAPAWEALARQKIQLRSLLQVKLTPPQGDQIARYVFVQGIAHRITREWWRTGLEFSSASVWYGLVDSRWDVGVWDSANWTW
jgi:hypothetical protein